MSLSRSWSLHLYLGRICLSLKGEKLSHSGGAQSRAAAPPHREGSAEVARASVPDASWTPSRKVFRARPTGRRPRGRPRTRWRDYVSQLAWERLGVPPRKSWRKCLGRGKSGHLCLDCCPPDPALDKRKKMDGWTF